MALKAFAESALIAELPLPALRVVVSSGEQLRITPEIRKWCRANPQLLLENQYGPTETHVVTSYTLSGPPQDYPTLPPIGRPIDGVMLQLLDQDRRPVPDGSTGEIWLGGTCLAQGYERRADLTAERFSAVEGIPMYRTGDLGTRLSNGEIAYLGRTDRQVKVRGYRVECAEVENAVLSLGDNVIRSGSRWWTTDLGSTACSSATSSATKTSWPPMRCERSFAKFCPPTWFLTISCGCRRCHSPRAASATIGR